MADIVETEQVADMPGPEAYNPTGAAAGTFANVANKRVADMTGEEARKLLTSGVANGVLLAGFVLVLLQVALGFVVAALSK